MNVLSWMSNLDLELDWNQYVYGISVGIHVLSFLASYNAMLVYMGNVISFL